MAVSEPRGPVINEDGTTDDYPAYCPKCNRTYWYQPHEPVDETGMCLHIRDDAELREGCNAWWRAFYRQGRIAGLKEACRALAFHIEVAEDL